MGLASLAFLNGKREVEELMSSIPRYSATITFIALRGEEQDIAMAHADFLRQGEKQNVRRNADSIWTRRS